jgi:diguanylate cyclase (GGDEF)-like protein
MSATPGQNAHFLFEDLDQVLGEALPAENATAAAPLRGIEGPQAQALLEGTGALALQINAEGLVQAASEATIRLLDYPREFILKSQLADMVHSADREALHALLVHARSSSKPRSATLRFMRGLTENLWLHLTVQTDSKGEAGDLLLFGYDVSKWINAEEELRAGALLDPLTETGNRTHMRDEITRAIASAQANNGGFAVALLDLDSFKKINDSLGHDAGDELLYEVSRRLSGTLRPSDVVGRIGGDEFAILLPRITTPQVASEVASRLLLAIQTPFPLAGHMLHVTASIGIALYPLHGETEAELIKHADLAMYQAKEHGKNRSFVYTDELAHRSNKTMSIELAMFEALQKGEFMLHYQPICNPHTHAVQAVESLMRWQRPSGPVSPAEFIPLAEENGLINLLGGWALRTASMQLARWDEIGLHLSYIAINVSPIQFHHPSFTATVKKALEDSGVDPYRIVLEITEGALMKDPTRANALLAELKGLGVRLAVDDFGTGYSSLAYLKSFPLSTLKIDQSFVRDMVNSQNDRAIVTAVLSLALEMGLSVVAEGVETQEQCQFLRDKGCTYVQGWLISKALPPQELEQRVQSGQLLLQPGPQDQPRN